MESELASPIPDLSGLHPFCRALLARWEAARGTLFAPSWRALDIIDIQPAAALAHCVMTEWTEDGADMIYRFFGTWHAVLHDRDLTGRRVLDLRPRSHGEHMLAQYRQAAAARRPLAFRFDLPILTGGRCQQELLRVPLSEDGTVVNAIVTCVVFLEGEKDGLAFFRKHQRAG